MAAGSWNFIIEQGATWIQPLTWTDDNTGQPIDLTGYSAHLQMRNGPLLTKGSQDILYCDMATGGNGITLDSNGKITLSLTAQQTASLAFTTAQYDLHLITPTGAIIKLLTGTITLVPGITIDSGGPLAVFTGGSGPVNQTTKTSDYTLTSNDYVILGDATSAPFTFTLPTAAGFTGVFVIAAITTNLNLITLAATTGQTIMGSSTVKLGNASSLADFISVTLISNGLNTWVTV